MITFKRSWSLRAAFTKTPYCAFISLTLVYPGEGWKAAMITYRLKFRAAAKKTVTPALVVSKLPPLTPDNNNSQPGAQFTHQDIWLAKDFIFHLHFTDSSFWVMLQTACDGSLCKLLCNPPPNPDPVPDAVLQLPDQTHTAKYKSLQIKQLGFFLFIPVFSAADWISLRVSAASSCSGFFLLGPNSLSHSETETTRITEALGSNPETEVGQLQSMAFYF